MDDRARPDDDADVGFSCRGEASRERCLVQRFAEPDDVRSSKAAAIGTSRKRIAARRVNGRPILTAPVAARAAAPEQGAVKFERERRGRVLSPGDSVRGDSVEAVDVLGDEGDVAAPRECEPCDGDVRNVRCAAGDDVPPPAVPLPDQPGIPRERFRGGEILEAMVLPQPVGAAECGDTGFGADSGAGEDQDAGSQETARRALIEAALRSRDRTSPAG
jgi:hypothetical protein